MKLKSFVTTMAALFMSATIVSAQYASDKLKPQWMHRLPNPTNSTFIYQVFSASSPNLEGARNATVEELINDAGLKSGAVVVSDHKSTEQVSQVWENGRLTEVVKNDSQTINSAKGKEITLHASLIDEYWTRDQNNLFHVHRLYAKSELGKMPLYDNVTLTTSYASDPANWGLMLIPGAAQMYKGSYLKGGLVMGGAVLFAGGIITFESMRADYVKKIATTHSADVKKAYNDRANNMATARNICIGGVAALYVYNIIDALVAPGARRVIVTPSATVNGQYGMSVQVNF